MHGIIQMNPPSAYLMAKGSRLEELEAMSKLELTKEASDHGIGNNQICNLALFPNQKKNIINELMANFDEEHSESVLAANLESEGASKNVIQRMSAKIVEKERSGWRVSWVVTPPSAQDTRPSLNDCGGFGASSSIVAFGLGPSSKIDAITLHFSLPSRGVRAKIARSRLAVLFCCDVPICLPASSRSKCLIRLLLFVNCESAHGNDNRSTVTSKR